MLVPCHRLKPSPVEPGGRPLRHCLASHRAASAGTVTCGREGCLTGSVTAPNGLTLQMTLPSMEQECAFISRGPPGLIQLTSQWWTVKDTALGTCSGLLDPERRGHKGQVLESNEVQPPRIDFTHIFDLL